MTRDRQRRTAAAATARALLVAGAMLGAVGTATVAAAQETTTRRGDAPTSDRQPPTSVASARRIPKIAFEKYTLPNGLEVILHEDHSTPVVAVNTWYHVGSGDEQRGRTGFAHLFEHIMFMGSQNVPTGKFDEWLESAGGNNNGSTTNDRTNYYEWLPANALPLALWLDADRMGFLLPTMDSAKVDLQRDVVKNERRERVDNVPYGRADETISAALFPASHPYSWPVIGSMTDLSAASIEDVKNFFRTYYAPNNATLVIAGDFQPADAKRLVEKYFGPIPRGPRAITRPTPPAFTVPRDTFLLLEDRVQLPRVFYAWHSVRIFDKDDAPLDVLAYVLAGDKNSRLYKKLVYELQVAQDVNAGQRSMNLDGEFQVDVTPKPNESPAKIDSLTRIEIRKVIDGGVTQRELERAQNTIRAQALDRIASVLGKSDQLNFYNYFAGTPDFVQQDEARYDAVTAADVQRVARTYLGAHKVVLTVVPQGKKEMMVMGGGQ
ncbi:MAG TPA: pitrilysin family protein [Gemmatimonadaceae bacterium]|nr:pitrilysin family protein [Gemmatimonadaceae bacterium]